MMKRVIGSIAATSLIFAGVVLLSGCAKCKSCGDSDSMAPEVMLPKGFVVMKGLCEQDYDSMGWPRYIMNCKDRSVMVLIPETTFTMGANGQEPNEQPCHQVTVGRYYIDLYEVSNVQFGKFATEVNCGLYCKDDPALANELLSTETSECWIVRNWKPNCDPCMKTSPERNSVELDVNYFKEYWKPNVNDCQPARAVSFWEAWYYTRWVGKDLPTEAEWELAAKGCSGRLYPWGNIEPDSQNLLCNYGGSHPAEDGFEYAAPVTAFGAGRSPFGVYNMAGNVWEWTKDYYDATFYSTPAFDKGGGRCATEAQRVFDNPSGPIYGCQRVIRGGSYTSDIADCRTTVRRAAMPNVHQMNVGFRGVLRIR